jgi:hypothetical protein
VRRQAHIPAGRIQINRQLLKKNSCLRFLHKR